MYISVDIDVLDPAYAPATCNPPGELLILGGRLRSVDGLRENLFRSYGAWVELISLARMSLKLLQFMHYSSRIDRPCSRRRGRKISGVNGQETRGRFRGTFSGPGVTEGVTTV